MFDWEEYLNFSKHIIYYSSEACFRSIISRCYYYSFNAVKEKLIQDYSFTQTATGDDHKLVTDELDKMKDNSNALELSLALKKLKKKRRQSDYNSNCNINKNEADTAINSAEEIKKKISLI